ncbi:MAG: hypothetical protein Wins2KO_22980 [Winogradskyella sp.]
MILDTIKKRRSVYPNQFSDKTVEKWKIEQILEAANWAPTHRKTEPWRFKVVLGESQIKLGEFLAEKFKSTTPKFSDFKYNKIKTNPTKAGAVIAICMQRHETIPEWEEIAATAMAVQNLWLATQDLELGGYWSSPALIEYMGEFFDLKEGERCLGFFYLGYIETPSMERVPSSIRDKVEWL